MEEVIRGNVPSRAGFQCLSARGGGNHRSDIDRGTTDEAGILDSDSAAAPSLGERRFGGEVLRSGVRDDNAPYAIVAVPGRRGMFLFCFLFCFFSDTPSVFGYAVGRGGFARPLDSESAFYAIAGTGVLGRDLAGDNACALSQGRSRGLAFWLIDSVLGVYACEREGDWSLVFELALLVLVETTELSLSLHLMVCCECDSSKKPSPQNMLRTSTLLHPDKIRRQSHISPTTDEPKHLGREQTNPRAIPHHGTSTTPTPGHHPSSTRNSNLTSPRQTLPPPTTTKQPKQTPLKMSPPRPPAPLDIPPSLAPSLTLIPPPDGPPSTTTILLLLHGGT